MLEWSQSVWPNVSINKFIEVCSTIWRYFVCWSHKYVVFSGQNPIAYTRYTTHTHTSTEHVVTYTINRTMWPPLNLPCPRLPIQLNQRQPSASIRILTALPHVNFHRETFLTPIFRTEFGHINCLNVVYSYRRQKLHRKTGIARLSLTLAYNHVNVIKCFELVVCV